MSVAVAAPPRSPYKGLSAFDDSELDALLFFGRERECDVIVANMLASRLTVLYGESGVGKSSVLSAGVVRELRRIAPAALVLVADAWSGEDVVAALDEARAAAECFLVLDQFEEFFVYHGGSDAEAFVAALAELLEGGGRAHVLVSLREDALAQLDAFSPAVPGMLANRLRLEELDREAARAAMLGPVERWNGLTGETVAVEPELVDAVLDEVASPRDADRVEAPFLQLVLERIWEAERAAGSTVLRLATLRSLGGAEAIVRDHLEHALDRLAPTERGVAAAVFDHLVTPSGTKIAHRLGDLAQYAGVDEAALERTLATLTRERIVRSIDGAAGAGRRYEIFHDVLAQPVRAWQARRELERERAHAERRQRRLVRIAAAALVALAVVAGIAIFALTQRSSARAQARHAHARELEATALQQLPVDPERSLLLALDAARLEPGAPAEDVLRQALIAARLRLVLSARGPVQAVAYSPDGRRIATAGTDGRTRLYDAATGALQHVLREAGRIGAVSFSPDGTRVLTGADDGLAVVWDASSGERLLRLGHGDAVTSASFARGGRLVLTSSLDGTARVWDAASGRLLRTLRHGGPVHRAAMSPDGTLVATAAEDPAGHVLARVFSVRTGRLLSVFPQRGVQDLAFGSDGALLAVASHDGSTRLFDPRSGRLVRELNDAGGAVSVVAFAPDGKLLATGSEDGGVRVWTVADGTRLFFFTGHTNPVVAVAWSPDGRVLGSASDDRSVRLWGVASLVEAGGPVALLAGHQDAVVALAFSPDGRRLVTGSRDRTARVWDAAPEQRLTLLGRSPGGAARARYDAAGRLVVAAGADGVARLWDAQTRRLVRTFGSAGAPLEDAVLSPDGAVLAAAGDDGTVRLWSVSTGARVATLPAGGLVHVASFSPDGRMVASMGTNGAALWDPATGRLLATLTRTPALDGSWSADSAELVTASAGGVAEWSGPAGRRLHATAVPGGVTRVAFAAVGDRFAVGGADGAVRLYDARSGALQHVLRGHTLPVTALNFSSDGRLLATSSVDTDGRLWDVASGTALRVLRGHFGEVADIALSPDARWIVTGGPISAGLWPVATGRILFYLRGHAALLSSVAFSPDGRQILTAGKDGTVRTYQCQVCGDLAALEALAQRRLERTARALTPAQRARYLQR